MKLQRGCKENNVCDWKMANSCILLDKLETGRDLDIAELPESNIQVKHEDLTKRSSRIEYKMRGKVGRPF